MSIRDKVKYAGDYATGGLFKFMPFDNPERQQRAEELLLGRAYFSVLPQFNDPFEGKMQLVDDDLSTFVRRARKKIYEIGKRRKTSMSERLELMDRAARRKPEDMLRETTLRHQARLEEDCRVFCLSGTRKRPLLWSHYANRHAGICVHFAHDKYPFGGALQVAYDANFPSSPMIAEADEDRHIQLLNASLLTKADFWAYEEEYRLVSIRMGSAPWHLGLNWSVDRTIAAFDPVVITGLTLGVRTPAPARARILEFCGAHRPDLSIEKAKLVDGRFELSFEPIT